MCFFSGTGNTFRVSSWLAGVFGRGGAKVELLPIEAVSPSSLPPDSPGSLLVVACPTHGFSAPWHFLKWVGRLPRVKSTAAVCVATRAGFTFLGLHPPGLAGTATFLPALILALKGYKVKGAASFNMPSNWMALHPGLPARAVESILAHSREEVEAFAGRVWAGGSAWLTLNNLYEFVFGLSMLPVTLIYMPVGRPSLGLSFFANPACTGCGLCVNNCPVGALSFKGRGEGRPSWSQLCESCMRCMGFCPTRAVEVGHSWLLLMALLSLVPLALFWTPLSNIEPLGLLGVGVAYLVFSYAGMIGAYGLFHRALESGPVRRFFSATTFTRFFRRYHEPSTRLKDLSPGKGA